MLRTVLVGFLIFGVLPAQQGSGCRSCNGHGFLECKLHGKGLMEKEQAVKFCSVCAECRSCQGALQTDCRTCGNPEPEAAIEARRKLVAEWLQGRRAAVDELTRNQPLLHLETAHFELVFSIKPLTVGRDKLDSHALMHLYGERLEALRAMFLEVLEVPTRDIPAQGKIYMFRDMQDHTLIAPRVTGFGGGRSLGQKLMGSGAVYCMFHDLRSMPDDEALHRNIVHNVTHLLLSNMSPPVWLGNRRHGWVDEGLSHWFEDKLTGKCTNFCFEEVLLQVGAGFKGGRWRVPVRRMVDTGKHKSFAELSQLNTDQLDFEDHALAFAYVDFLITSRGGSLFRDLIRAIKRATEMRDALRQVYKLDPFSIDEAFRQWVKENYSLQDR